jgi:hypothetical protein
VWVDLVWWLVLSPWVWLVFGVLFVVLDFFVGLVLLPVSLAFLWMVLVLFSGGGWLFGVDGWFPGLGGVPRLFFGFVFVNYVLVGVVLRWLHSFRRSRPRSVGDL